LNVPSPLTHNRRDLGSLYYKPDLVITHALEWPSLTVQWLPVSRRRGQIGKPPGTQLHQQHHQHQHQQQQQQLLSPSSANQQQRSK